MRGAKENENAGPTRGKVGPVFILAPVRVLVFMARLKREGGLARFGALLSSAGVHRFARFLFGAEFLRNVVLYQKFLVTLRAGTAADEPQARVVPPRFRRLGEKNMRTVHAEPTEEEWRELARQAAGEEDPDRLLSIVKRYPA